MAKKVRRRTVTIRSRAEDATAKSSPAEQVQRLAVHEYAHQSTDEIKSKLRVLQAELDEADLSILGVQADLAKAKARRTMIDAQVRGLTSVVERR